MNTELKLSHGSKKSDEELNEEMKLFVAQNPPVQLVAELVKALRNSDFPWWSPEHLRAHFPMPLLMEALKERPDIRQNVTSKLTGFRKNAARKLPPASQAELIESVLESDDINDAELQSAFDVLDLTVYLGAAAFWRLFRDKMPWSVDNDFHRVVICTILNGLLAQRGDLDPIMTPNQLLRGIDRKVWEEHMLIEIRALIGARLLELEKTDSIARVILEIATPELIVENIPLQDLQGVMDAAQTAMGFDPPTETSVEVVVAEPDDEVVVVTEVNEDDILAEGEEQSDYDENTADNAIDGIVSDQPSEAHDSPKA